MRDTLVRIASLEAENTCLKDVVRACQEQASMSEGEVALLLEHLADDNAASIQLSGVTRSTAADE
ncbi:hypothetical protein ASD52_34740 [Ensifer sp. Root142]|nr:hypothetical protein ASD52_34740 [Ensifer sp. Root142]